MYKCGGKRKAGDWQITIICAITLKEGWTVRPARTLKFSYGKERGMFSWLQRKQYPLRNVREWNVMDIPHIMNIVSQNPQSGWNYDREEWHKMIRDPYHYGIVIEDDHTVRGCVMVSTKQSQCVYIDLFQVDENHRREGCGTRMMDHLCAKAREWKQTLCFDVRDTNKDLHLFLISEEIGFVPTEIHEFYDEEDDHISAMYTMEYPPPWDYRKGTIRIVKKGKATTKSFPKTPDTA